MAAMSTSSCTVETAHGMHVFHVHQYSLLKALGIRRSVRSATFTIDGYDWAISLYPSGAASPQRVSVALDLLAVPSRAITAEAPAVPFMAVTAEAAAVPSMAVTAEAPAVPSMAVTAEARAVFAILLVDQQTPERRISLLPGGKSRTFHMFLGTPMPSSYCFDVDRKTLESPPYLVDDRLVIGCEITVIKTPHVSATRPLPRVQPPPPPGLSKDLGELLEAGVAADVTFHVRGEVFAAHRAVLVARSPVFKAELLGPMKENASGHVSIEDMQPAVFKAMLGFVYTDELPAMADLDGDDYTEMHRHLVVAADRYDMARLKQMCENLLCSRLDARTVKTTRDLAQQHHCDRLGKACEQFFFSKFLSAPQPNKRPLPLPTKFNGLFPVQQLRVMPATTSSCTTETAHGVHVFQIHQYSYLRCLGAGRFVRSGSFVVGGCDWAIRLYPACAESPWRTLVCVELLRSEGDEVVTEVGVRLVDLATGQTRSLLPDAKPKQFRTFLNNTTSPDRVFSSVVEKKDFEARPFLEDDRMAIQCEITTIEVPRVPENQALPDFENMAPPPPPAVGLSKDLGELLETGAAADVTFRHAGGEVFSAHRALLVARSPVFKAELLAWPTMEDKNAAAAGHVNIVDGMLPQVFKAVLEFIYTDALPAMEDLDGDGKTDMHQRLMVAADQYGIERLKQLCESILCGTLNTRTVKATLHLAERYGCDWLKEACEQFIVLIGIDPSCKRRKLNELLSSSF